MLLLLLPESEGVQLPAVAPGFVFFLFGEEAGCYWELKEGSKFFANTEQLNNFSYLNHPETTTKDMLVVPFDYWKSLKIRSFNYPYTIVSSPS